MNWEQQAKALQGAIELIGVVISRYREGRADNRAAAGIKSAIDALTVVAAVVETARSASGEVDLDAFERELDRFRAALRDNDDAADRALADKFDPSGQ